MQWERGCVSAVGGCVSAVGERVCECSGREGV